MAARCGEQPTVLRAARGSGASSRALRRLPRDHPDVYGQRVLAVGRFTDPARNSGARYGASNFVGVGDTLDDSLSAGRHHHHGSPKWVVSAPCPHPLSAVDSSPQSRRPVFAASGWSWTGSPTCPRTRVGGSEPGATRWTLQVNQAGAFRVELTRLSGWFGANAWVRSDSTHRELLERLAFDARWNDAAGGPDSEYLANIWSAHTVLVDMRARLARSDRSAFGGAVGRWPTQTCRSCCARLSGDDDYAQAGHSVCDYAGPAAREAW